MFEAIVTEHQAEVVSDLDRLKSIDKESPAPLTEFRFGSGTFRLLDGSGGEMRGVYFVAEDRDGNEKAPMWLCAPLRVLAQTRDARSGEWGRLLEWADADGVRHRWAMPIEAVTGDGTDARRELARQGLAISPSRAARDMLTAFLSVWPTAERARCTDRLGWLGGAYVLPGEAIGAERETVVFQSAQAIEPALSTAGTADDWRGSVAALAQGNSRVVFAICAALAPPLMDLVNEQSGGFHLRGASSSGKSTMLTAAASVWGRPADYTRLWRVTSNGLEGLCAMHNDGLLVMDELSQVSPSEAGESAYMIANGVGKVRASRTGAARASARWRLLFLSAGEESLSGLMLKAGKKSNAGQEIRMADIEADAGVGMGAFEALHDQPSPSALSLALKDAAAKHHGAVGVAWLRYVVQHRTALADWISASVRAFVTEHTPQGASGQVQRVARRFGLVAAAGELATHCGLTGWQEGDASAAVGRCFASWLEGFGGIGNKEERALLSQIRHFFETHGASRFEDMAATVEQRVINRAGFFRDGDDGSREYLVLPEVFTRELCAGFDSKLVAKTLVGAGIITPGTDGRVGRKVRLPGIGTTVRVYVMNSKLWSSAD